MSRRRVFITRPIPQEGIDRIKAIHTVELRKTDSPISRQELVVGMKKAEALLCILTDKIDAKLMDTAPQLQVISNYAVGVDNIDIAAATERGIVVTNTPGVLDEAVAEHALALMFSVARRIVESDTFTRAKKYKAWMPMGFLGPQLKGKTLGIIGAGRIGSTLAEAAYQGLGMKVLYHDVQSNTLIEKKAKAQYSSLSVLLKNSDVVSVHVPLLPSTRHLIDAKELRLMKKTAILINTSRGPVVAEKPLIRALQNGRLSGAGLDVYECEPFIDCDTSDRLELVKLNNVVLTPHTASATEEARIAMSELAATGVIDTLRNKKPINIVNPEVWSHRRK